METVNVKRSDRQPVLTLVYVLCRLPRLAQTSITSERHPGLCSGKGRQKMLPATQHAVAMAGDQSRRQFRSVSRQCNRPLGSSAYIDPASHRERMYDCLIVRTSPAPSTSSSSSSSVANGPQLRWQRRDCHDDRNSRGSIIHIVMGMHNHHSHHRNHRHHHHHRQPQQQRR